jgi:signal transduction histidine kinase/DNA-binding response OmpR family regulator
MSKPLKILLVEDNPGDADLIQEMLPTTDESGFVVHCVSRLSEAVSHLEEKEADLTLLDLDLPDSQGIETVRLAHQAAPKMPIVVLTGNQDERLGIAAVQGGAQDFLIKGQTHQSQLSRVLRYAVQRHCAEEKMRESERFLRSTLDALSAHIAIIDQTGKILAANMAWREFADAPGGHILRCREQANYFDACGTVQRGNAEDACFAEAFAEGVRSVLDQETDQFEMEYQMHSREEKLWFHGQVTPFPSGNERKVVVAHENITDRKKAEEERLELAAQLRHTYKMEAIGTLAGGIAHDFNNILASVLGYVELSLLDLKKGGQLEKNLQEVYQAGTRAKELVQQILTFARKDESHIQPTQICAIAKEASKLIRSTIPASIEVRLTVESKAYAMAEPTQIHQIFMNLFTNAAHAMDRNGGILSVNISETTLDKSFDSMHSAFTPGTYLQITVSDTGTGISKNKLEKIFDPYFTTKGGKEGTGLGLSVVHGIIRNHGGEITVKSKTGKGTTFTIYLPLTAQTATDHISITKKLPKGSERILFIDDELPITDMSRQRLSLLGYQVTAVNNSPEALRRLMATPDKFDLIITDMTMPRMSGEQLAIEAQKIKPDIPIILCTGYSKKISKEKAAAIGIGAVLMKPVTIREMAETIRTVLGDG